MRASVLPDHTTGSHGSIRAPRQEEAGRFDEPLGTKVALIYDGDCPMCTHFSKAIRIREDIGPLALINARASPDIVKQLDRLGVNLNEGIVLVLGDQIYHGVSALTLLAALCTRATTFNRFTFHVFSRSATARALYPLLKLTRVFLLKAMRKNQISNAIRD